MAEADRAQSYMNRAAIEFARDAAHEYGIDQTVFNPCSKVHGAASEAGDRHNQDYATHLIRPDKACQWLDANAMRALTGTDHYRSGLHAPGTVQLPPAAFVRQLAAGICVASTKMQLIENSAVLAMSDDAGGWRLNTAQGVVSAGRVIKNGVRAGSSGLADRPGLEFHAAGSRGSGA